jgi:outer membrane protein assembly factor BamD (BamD/ComL family)
MIDAARRQLGAGNSKGALEQLDRYRKKCPQGVLGQEATLLRIEALAQGGNHAAARQLARRYLASHPNSQYAKRIQSLIGANKKYQRLEEP